MKKKYTVVDLFCGAGGLSKGFLDADFDVVVGVDFDDASLRTFEANHGSAKAMKLDLFDHNNINEIKKYLDDKNIKLDVLVGGPPCQGFSMAGARIRNGFIDDPRNYLFKHYFNVVKAVKPKAFVIENVKVIVQILNEF